MANPYEIQAAYKPEQDGLLMVVCWLAVILGGGAVLSGGLFAAINAAEAAASKANFIQNDEQFQDVLPGLGIAVLSIVLLLIVRAWAINRANAMSRNPFL